MVPKFEAGLGHFLIFFRQKFLIKVLWIVLKFFNISGELKS